MITKRRRVQDINNVFETIVLKVLNKLIESEPIQTMSLKLGINSRLDFIRFYSLYKLRAETITHGRALETV